MSWDPNQGQNPNQGSNYINPQDQRDGSYYPYGQPPHPYTHGTPPNPTYGVPSPNPYNPTVGVPPNPTYGIPSPDPYNATVFVPPNPTYGVPSAHPYNNTVFVPPNSTYIAPPPPNEELTQPSASRIHAQQLRSVSKAIQELPAEYLDVITHPSAEKFIEEQVKADWSIVIVQVISLCIITIVFGLMRELFVTAAVTTSTGSMGVFATFADLTVSTSATSALFSILYIPVLFFIGAGVQFLFARAFGGRGNFLQQSYTQLLYKMPLDIVGKFIYTILAFIPTISVFVSPLVYLALLVYSIILNIFQIKAVHRLSIGKAIGAVLIPYSIAAVFILLILVVASVYIFNFLHIH